MSTFNASRRNECDAALFRRCLISPSSHAQRRIIIAKATATAANFYYRDVRARLKFVFVRCCDSIIICQEKP